jgi:hypothetical protein
MVITDSWAQSPVDLLYGPEKNLAEFFARTIASDSASESFATAKGQHRTFS